MADEMNVNQETMEIVGAEIETSTETIHKDDATDISELMARLAEMTARAEKAERNERKTKLAYDKVASQYAEKKKEERARMTAEEQEEETRKEAERIKNEKFAEMERELNRIKAVAAYKGKVADDKIDVLIDAVTDNDHDAIANAVQSAYERGKKDGQVEYLKNRPQVGAGSGSAMTMDEIMAIKDTSERQRAIAQNIHLFNN